MVRSFMPRSFVTRFAKMAPVVIGSVVLHAGLAMALVATAGGHARAGVTLPVATLDVDLASIESPMLEPVREEVPPPPKAERDHDEAVPAHTHPYPVAPSHDAHPHDPSLHHEEAPATPAPADDHAHEAEAEAAQPAPVQVAEPAALPRFSIPSGAGLATSGHVSANAGGTGAGTAAAPSGGGAGADDAIVAASGVHVSAKLAQSVVAAYPAGARSDDVEGDVGVEIVVDREGRVVDARVVRPAGHGFDDAALAAIRRYRFTPAQRDGHAVRVRMPWSVQFRLR